VRHRARAENIISRQEAVMMMMMVMVATATPQW
jgi:hypothetical protein